LALATCELAAEVLRGRLGGLRAFQVLGWVNIIAGTAFAVWGIVGLIIGHQVDGLPFLFPVGALFAMVGVAFAFWRPEGAAAQGGTGVGAQQGCRSEAATAEVTATPPAAGPTRRITAITDPEFKAR
jgi:hypothetical protein